MTDMTSIAAHEPARRGRRSAPPRLEYRAYFAVILAAALPGATLGWAWGSLTGRGDAGRGPIARALDAARTITPQIFHA